MNTENKLLSKVTTEISNSSWSDNGNKSQTELAVYDVVMENKARKKENSTKDVTPLEHPHYSFRQTSSFK